MLRASQVLARLYTSDLWTTIHVTTLISLGIVHLLSIQRIQIAPLDPSPPPKDVALNTRCIPLQDKCKARL